MKKAKCQLTDRTGELWERYLNDKNDAVWLVIGPPEDDNDMHPCLTLVGERAGVAEHRVENVDARQIWEDCSWLRRLV